jgi:hypothetical protein
MAESTPPTLPREVVLHVAGTCLCLHTQRAARALAREARNLVTFARRFSLPPRGAGGCGVALYPVGKAKSFNADPFPYHAELELEIATLTNLGIGLARVCQKSNSVMIGT